MTDLAHGIWAAATASIAFSGGRVAITWLNQRERKNVRDEHRDERDNGVMAKVEALEKAFADVRNEQKLFIANHRGGR